MSQNPILARYTEYSPKVQELLEPLRSTYNIDNFFYTELLPKKGKAYFLSNKCSTIEKLLNIGRFSIQHNTFLTEIKEGDCQKFVWPQESTDAVGTMLKSTGIRCGLSFLYRVEDSIMNIGFASTERSDSLLSMMVNKEELFCHFIKYFESEVHDILEEKSKYLSNFNSHFQDTQFEKNRVRLNKCIEAMEIKKLFINGTDESDKKYLTRREYICLHLLCKGKSAKQIAYELGLSTRTIEAYLTTCKAKLNSTNKFDLFSRSIDLGLDKLCIPDIYSTPSSV